MDNIHLTIDFVVIKYYQQIIIFINEGLPTTAPTQKISKEPAQEIIDIKNNKKQWQQIEVNKLTH